MKTIRFGVSLDEDLLNQFDGMIEKQQYASRSEAIRDLIRKSLIKEEWENDEDIAGAVVLVYDHHVRQLKDKLDKYQHRHHREIISTVHCHLDEENCMEIIIVQGKSSSIKKFSDFLIGTRGVKHGQFVATTTGALIK